MDVRKKFSAAAASVALASVCLLSGATPAAAIGGNCSHGMQRIDQPWWDDDDYRAWARCSSLEANSKAQGELTRVGVHKYTVWFTRLNTTYYTNWYIWGTGSTVTIARV